MTLTRPNIADKSQYLALLVLAAVAVLAYAPALHAPWYLDDYPAIVNNAQIRNLSWTIADFFTQRGLVTLSLALNLRFFGMETFSFHLVNLLLHLTTTGFVLLCLRRVFVSTWHWPIIGAAIFALHPLQTQAVTYIVQRATSLSALFLFMALYCYIKAVEEQTAAEKPKKQSLFYAGCLLSGALAVTTKQNTATLPLLLLVFDYFFLARAQRFPWRKKLVYVAPLFIAPALVAVLMLLLPTLSGENWQTISNFEPLNAAGDITPLTYLATEFSVFWIYLRLFPLPIHQVLDYGYPFAASLFALKPLLALTGIVALFSAAYFLRRRWPCALFFLTWMVLSLAVESSFIPLDPIFEHRLYIPLFGFSILLTDLLARASRKSPGATLAAGLALLAVFATLSYKRNEVWNKPLKLYAGDVDHGYGSYRSLMMLADSQFRAGEREAAKTSYDRAVARIEKEGLSRAGSKMLVNLAIAYGRFDDFGQAEKLLRLALEKDPRSPQAHYNLGVAYYLQNRHREALQHFTITYELQPGNAHALFYYLLLSARFKRDIDYQGLLDELSRQDRNLAIKLRGKLPAF